MITLGMDIGSTTSKCVLLKDGVEIVAWALAPAGIGTDGPAQAYREVLLRGGVPEREIGRKMATGYGRKCWPPADGELSELTAHALGCHLLLPQARTVIDIGGQDAKVVSLDAQGRMAGFVMNDKCAAGTGRFLDVMAGILKRDVDELGGLAAQAAAPAAISSTCTVFAESEVISQLANGVPVPDVVAGICRSVAVRVAALARRAGVKEAVFMSGGVARNAGVRKALEDDLGVTLHTSELSQLAGALGAAVYGFQKMSQ